MWHVKVYKNIIAIEKTQMHAIEKGWDVPQVCIIKQWAAIAPGVAFSYLYARNWVESDLNRGNLGVLQANKRDWEYIAMIFIL